MSASLYFSFRKEGEKNWTAYPFPKGERPVARRGYEMTGPHANLVAALIDANRPLRAIPRNSAHRKPAKKGRRG